MRPHDCLLCCPMALLSHLEDGAVSEVVCGAGTAWEVAKRSMEWLIFFMIFVFFHDFSTFGSKRPILVSQVKSLDSVSLDRKNDSSRSLFGVGRTDG